MLGEHPQWGRHAEGWRRGVPDLRTQGPFSPSLPYPQYFGGVSALTPDQYLKMNGFPNEYWGWGGEDDDIAARSDFCPPHPPLPSLGPSSEATTLAMTLEH